MYRILQRDINNTNDEWTEVTWWTVTSEKQAQHVTHYLNNTMSDKTFTYELKEQEQK